MCYSRDVLFLNPRDQWLVGIFKISKTSRTSPISTPSVFLGKRWNGHLTQLVDVILFLFFSNSAHQVKMAVDEQQPLLQGECPQQCYAEFPDAPGVDSSKPNSTAGKEAGVDTAVLAVMILGAFLAFACESMVASTQEEIASDFNALSLAPWLLMAYSMGYSMILPLVSAQPR